MFEKLRKSIGRLLSALYAALLVNTAAAAVISASPAETLPADLSGYAMSRVTSSTPVEVKIENTVVSGVYIIREGDKVTKTVIR